MIIYRIVFFLFFTISSLAQEVSYYPLGDDILSDEIESIYKDSRGLLWIGTKNIGLYVYDGSNIEAYPITKIKGDDNREYLYSGKIIDITEDNKGRIWLLVDRGIVVITLNSSEGVLLDIYKNGDRIEGGKCFSKMRNGEIWCSIGFNHGLIICLLYTSPSPRDGLLSRMPSSA